MGGGGGRGSTVGRRHRLTHAAIAARCVMTLTGSNHFVFHFFTTNIILLKILLLVLYTLSFLYYMNEFWHEHI